MISIIIPAHQEEKRIAKTLNEYCKMFRGEEIIVSLNACTDKTLEVVKEFQKTYSNLRYIESEIGAKGSAIIERQDDKRHNLRIENFLSGFKKCH